MHGLQKTTLIHLTVPYLTFIVRFNDLTTEIRFPLKHKKF